MYYNHSKATSISPAFLLLTNSTYLILLSLSPPCLSKPDKQANINLNISVEKKGSGKEGICIPCSGSKMKQIVTEIPRPSNKIAVSRDKLIKKKKKKRRKRGRQLYMK